MTQMVVHCRRSRFDVYVGRGRGSPWGNPFSWKDGTLAKFLCKEEDCLRLYEEWVRRQPALVARIRTELKDKVLGCWCKMKGDEPCHGDVLVRIANEEADDA